jgi:hypothetical protein
MLACQETSAEAENDMENLAPDAYRFYLKRHSAVPRATYHAPLA